MRAKRENSLYCSLDRSPWGCAVPALYRMANRGHCGNITKRRREAVVRIRKTEPEGTFILQTQTFILQMSKQIPRQET